MKDGSQDKITQDFGYPLLGPSNQTPNYPLPEILRFHYCRPMRAGQYVGRRLPRVG